MKIQQKRLTIKDIAKLAGVSFQTVSLVLNDSDKVAESTFKRVRSVIEAVNFVPNVAARTMRQISTKTLACIFFGERASYDNRITQIQDTYWNNVVQMLMRVSDSRGYTLLQRHLSNDDDKAFTEIRELFVSGRIDGLIAVVSQPNHPVLSKLKENNFPFLVFGTQEKNYPCVTQSNKLVTEKIVKYLYLTGCERMVFISGERDGKPNQDIIERLKGFKSGMKANGLSIHKEWMLIGDWSFKSGYNIAQQLCSSSKKPDAIIFASDRMALGALKGLHDLGLNIPKDVSIVGFDNMQYDEFSIPSLSSVNSPIFEMSNAALDILIKGIENNLPLPIKQVTFKAELVVRESTNKPL